MASCVSRAAAYFTEIKALRLPHLRNAGKLNAKKVTTRNSVEETV